MATSLARLENGASFGAVRADPAADLGALGAFVLQKRRLNASWSAISAMTGVSVPKLQAEFGRIATPETVSPTPLRATPPVAVEPPPPRQPPKPYEKAQKPAPLGELLDMLRPGPMSAAAMAAKGGFDVIVVSYQLHAASKRGLVKFDGKQGDRGGLWSLTEAGAAHNPRQARIRSIATMLAPLREATLTGADISSLTGATRALVSVRFAGYLKAGLVETVGRVGKGYVYRLTETGRAQLDLAEAAANG